MKTKIQNEALRCHNWDFVPDQASESCLLPFNLTPPSLPPSGSAPQVNAGLAASSCAQPNYRDRGNPVQDLPPHPTSPGKNCNPNPTNSSSTTTSSTCPDVVLLPDGTQMILGEKSPLEPPTSASEFEFIFEMMDLVYEGEHLPQPRKVPEGEKQSDGSFLDMFGLGQPEPKDSERERKKSGQKSGGDKNAGGGGPPPGGGGGPPGGSSPGTPVSRGWQDLEIKLDPSLIGDGPYSKATSAQDFLKILKILFKRVALKRDMAGFKWLPETDIACAENASFLALVCHHVMLNVGPGSNLEAGLVDFFRYPNSPVGGEVGALALKDFVAQGVTIDYSAKFVLSGVNLENPAEFFSVVDTDDGEPPESPNEIYLRPSISLVSKCFKTCKRKGTDQPSQ